MKEMSPEEALALCMFITANDAPTDALPGHQDKDQVSAWNKLWALAGFSEDPGCSSFGKQLHMSGECGGLESLCVF